MSTNVHSALTSVIAMAASHIAALESAQVAGGSEAPSAEVLQKKSELALLQGLYGSDSAPKLPIVVVTMDDEEVSIVRSSIPAHVVVLDATVDEDSGLDTVRIFEEDFYASSKILTGPSQPMGDGVDPYYCAGVVEQVAEGMEAT